MSTQKRVVHLTTVHHPYDPRIYHKECQSLKDAGYDVTLIAQEAKDGVHPIRHIPVKTYNSRLTRMIFGTMDAYKKSKELDADVYHFHDPELLPVGWLLKKKHNVVIYDIHEDYITSILQKDYLTKPIKKLAAAAYKYMEKFFSRRMALCLAEKYYKDIYPRGYCILNYPTVNQTFVEHERQHEPLEDELLYTGNVSYVRGAQIHAKIPLIHDKVSVHFVGKCPGHLAEEINDIAGEQKDRLKLEGIDRFIEKEDIEAKYLSRNWLAGIALFPPTQHYKKKELTKFFEYMNAGIPILCSNFTVWKNFVETYECGVAVDPYDESQIKEAIDYLRDNPDKAKQMGENGKKAVMDQLNWDVEEQKLILWYDRLIANTK
ncbi:Glycosyltransferase involved in cell wall bisynthesis [Lentibacillus halodurans]|uniref:Glycosyltransferase involved in cell wall bisynthesis n=1 Tax=Lentibacillus halodurans TaxID=237679 RepID=A0A1I0ZSY1_9BACI|nr:glycosyltransferase [Lentibacillus halodurans]SFB27293.1 Glycosyltransferase involved in cell wall bisynthesis [Lentibacillus halodurans]